jgi:hypothetical protein
MNDEFPDMRDEYPDMEFKKCPKCGMAVPTTLGKISPHGGSGFMFPCIGTEIGCLSPKNIEDMKKNQ